MSKSSTLESEATAWTKHTFVGQNRDASFIPALAELIIDSFAADIRRSGGKFIIVHLPLREAVNSDMPAERLSYGSLLKRLKARSWLSIL